jgi:hypothetical protein
MKGLPTLSTRSFPLSRTINLIIDFAARNQSSLRNCLLGSAFFAPVFSLIIGLFNLKDSWDDGAITAAFSRTFAATGIIALTPLSPQVEGFSSLSWLFLLALAHPFAASASMYLIWMKVLSALFFILAILVFLPLCRTFIAVPILSSFATWLMAFSITPFREAFNGMEMNLALFLFLVLIYILTSEHNRGIQFISAWIVSSFLLATRFEAPYMLLALLIGCALGRDSEPKCPSLPFLLALFTASCGSFVGIGLWRHHRFGLWMPNTIYAKLWWPYQPRHIWPELLGSRAKATLEIIVVLFAPLLVTLFLYVRNRSVIRNRPIIAIHPIIGSLAAATILFGAIFGNNLGHRGRMIESLIPFAIIFLIIVLTKVSRSHFQTGLALLVIAVLHFGLWFGMTYRLAIRGDGVPISKLEREGLAADDIRQALHRERLTIMIPDVGGAALCCNKLRILDIALLTNPVLAREGYSHFNSYFNLSQPDIVEVHEVWAEASHIYSSGLLDGYSLVQSRQVRLFVRNDLYSQLLSVNAGFVRNVGELPYCLGNSREDQEYSKRKGVCFVLRE